MSLAARTDGLLGRTGPFHRANSIGSEARILMALANSSLTSLRCLRLAAERRSFLIPVLTNPFNVDRTTLLGRMNERPPNNAAVEAPLGWSFAADLSV